MYKGLDISTIQHGTNFVAVKNAGIDFVICRCSVGNNGTDTDYSSNIEKAKAAGLLVAAYHFIFPLPHIDPVQQAQAHYKAGMGELAACDAEWPYPGAGWQKWGCSASQINDWTLQYLEEFSRLDGRSMVIYTYPDWANNVKFSQDYAKYPLWIASYTTTPYIPKPWTDWTWWQNSSGPYKLPVSGVAVDTDIAKDLSLWGATQPSVPQTAPVPVINTTPPTPAPTPIPAEPAPQPVAPAPQPAAVSVQPPSVSNLLPTIEQVAQNILAKPQNGILTLIQNVFWKVIKALFHIR